MIGKVVHGYRPSGLIAYLFGPGQHEEHRNPRVIASWDHAPWCHQPPKLAAVWLDGERIEPGEFDFDLRGLNRTMQELLEAAGLPTANPPEMTAEWAGRLERGQAVGSDAPPWVKNYKYDRNKEAVVLRQGPVWHCPVRLHPDDPTLTDQQWEYIAERLMKAVGIQQEGCRWIAVRHGDDHIHLMATLVSERTGKRVYPYHDYYKLRDECRALEKEFGLVETPDVDWTASRQPSRKEIGKAQRKGRDETARQELRRVVAQCAAGAQNGAEFAAKLKAEGLILRTRSDSEGTICGYSVALPGDVTKDGDPVRYSGGALAADLTWPKLMARWETVPPSLPVPRGEDERVSPAQRRATLDDATTVVGQAAAAVQAAIRGATTGEDVDGIAHAVGEVLSVLSRGQEDRERGPLAEISERYDRAARTPHRVLPRRVGPLAAELRRASRQIGAAGALTGRGKERFATVALLLALAGLVAEIAAWQQSRGRVHQAAAARGAAGALPGLAQPTDASRRPRPSRPAQPPAAGGFRYPRATPRPQQPREPRPRRGPG